jgi:hypothetical protein
MCGGIAEVNEEPIAEVLCQVALMSLDHCRADLLILLYDRPIVLGIKLSREGSRTNEITECHRELPPLGFGWHRTELRDWRRGCTTWQFLGSACGLTRALLIG